METFDEANEKNKGSGASGGEYDRTVPVDFMGEELGERFDGLETIMAFFSRRQRQQPDRDIDVSDPTQQQPQGIDLDLSALDNAELLTVLIRVNLNQLSAMLDIRDAVQAPRTITVSGVNIIDDPDNPQEVVTGSESGDIPTKRLYIKASKSNTADVAFGDDSVDPQTGFVLSRGESIVLEHNITSSPLYMASEEADQIVELIGVA